MPCPPSSCSARPASRRLLGARAADGWGLTEEADFRGGGGDTGTHSWHVSGSQVPCSGTCAREGGKMKRCRAGVFPAWGGWAPPWPDGNRRVLYHGKAAFWSWVSCGPASRSADPCLSVPTPGPAAGLAEWTSPRPSVHKAPRPEGSMQRASARGGPAGPGTGGHCGTPCVSWCTIFSFTGSCQGVMQAWTSPLCPHRVLFP